MQMGKRGDHLGADGRAPGEARGDGARLCLLAQKLEQARVAGG